MNNIIKLSKLIMVGILAMLIGGCASITGNSGQNLSVDVRTKDGKAIDGVKCQLSNDKGNWYTKSPFPVMVQKSATALTVVCKKEGYACGTTKVASSANGGMFGNIIFGGGVGAIIDHSKGTAYNYPEIIPVEMGLTIDLGKKTKKYLAEKEQQRKNAS